MNGEQLYALYVQANDEQSIGVDGWNEIAVDDWHVWNRIAQLAASAHEPPDARDMWISQALPLIEAIADYERRNGTAGALMGVGEHLTIAGIVERWALVHNARGLVEQVKGTAQPPRTALVAELRMFAEHYAGRVAHVLNQAADALEQ